MGMIPPRCSKIYEELLRVKNLSLDYVRGRFFALSGKKKLFHTGLRVEAGFHFI